MGKPYPMMQNNASRMPVGTGQPVQIISDTKFTTKTFAIGAAAALHGLLHHHARSQDATLDWYDAANQLVTSAKQFVIQGLGSNIISTSIADVNAFIQSAMLILTCQQKEIGRQRLRNLCSAGGPFVAGAQVAAASSVGVINGNPRPNPGAWRSCRSRPTRPSRPPWPCRPSTPYTVIASTTVEIDLFGFEVRPAA